MQFGEDEVARLVENCKKLKANLKNAKGFEDLKPQVDLLQEIAETVDREEYIGGKDEW